MVRFNKHLLFTVLDVKKFKIKVPVDVKSGEDPPSGVQMAIFFLFPHLAENRERTLCPLSLQRHWSHQKGSHAPDQIIHQKPYPQEPAQWGWLKFQDKNLGEIQTFSP